MGKFCPYCGGEIRALAGFCPHCGKKLAGEGEIRVSKEERRQKSPVGLEEALDKARCKLSPTEVFRILGFGQRDLIDWRRAKWSQRGEEQSNVSGIVFLTNTDFFFVSRALWPAKLSEKQIKSELVRIPLRGIRKLKATKMLFAKNPSGVRIKGEVERRAILFRKTFRRGSESFFMERPQEFIESIRRISPGIEIN